MYNAPAVQLPARPRRLLRSTLAATLCVASFLGSACRATAGEPATRPASTAEVDLFDEDQHIRTRDVTVGMTGHGLSVFRGTEIERFEVEVIGILRNSEQIDTDVVLIRCSGANLEHTGPVAGMSGSPIYLNCPDGKTRLLGAFAFGWPASKDPIAGVQPIEQMLQARRLTSRAAPPKARPQAVFNLARGWLDKPFGSAALDRLLTEPAAMGGGTQLAALPIPLGIGGLQTGSPLPARLAGFGPLVPMQAGAATGPADEVAEIAPGSPLIVPVVQGDLNVAATGTCTAVIDGRVFGFGHPMNGDGSTSLPFTGGQIDATIATQQISFKLGRPGPIVGTLDADIAAGVAGVLGEAPEMADVSLTVAGPDAVERRYDFRVADHPQLTLVGLLTAMQAALDFAGSGDPEGGTQWSATYVFEGGHDMQLADLSANATGINPALPGVLMPVMTLQNSPFGRVPLERLEIRVETIPADDFEAATLVGLTTPTRRVERGGTLGLDLELRADDGGLTNRRVELDLPADLAPGTYMLSLSDSATALQEQAMRSPYLFEARDNAGIFSALERVSAYGSKALYARIDREEAPGLAIGSTPLPDVPASRARLLLGSGKSEVAPFLPSWTHRIEMPLVVTESQASVQIVIE